MCKKYAIGMFIVAAALALTACGCEHEWSEATCIELSTCIKCGKTEGEYADHKWAEATCSTPKTCTVCGATDGEALGHQWQDATCVRAKTCKVCKETEGNSLGHKWKDATCTEPETCTVCSTTRGSARGHSVDGWTVVSKPTCSEQGEKTGVCKICGEDVSEKIEPLDHVLGEEEIITPATSTTEGKKAQKCTLCGEYVKTYTYYLEGEEKEAAFKKECGQYTYKEIARNPDDYMFKQMYFKGEVIQVLEDGNTVQLRVNVTKNGRYWDDTIFVQYTRGEGEPRILEDDIIKIYGYGWGTVTYESVLGAKITLPAVVAQYIDY